MTVKTGGLNCDDVEGGVHDCLHDNDDEENDGHKSVLVMMMTVTSG